MNKKWTYLCFLIALAISFSFYVKESFTPKISYIISSYELERLPSLSPPSLEGPCSQEFRIGQGFYHELDLYRAITAFKTALILSDKESSQAIDQLHYSVIFCYYLAFKYEEVISTFENSPLIKAEESLPFYHDLLVILFESYTKMGLSTKAERILSLIKHYFPSTYSKLFLWERLSSADFEALANMQGPSLQSFLKQYASMKKSPLTTQLLNTFLPGSGYLYLGQYQSALTSFFLNGTFIWAAWHNFIRKSIAAGLIFSSIEMGWYYGGVYGGGDEANFFNKRVYETLAKPYMAHEKLFPILLLQKGI